MSIKSRVAAALNEQAAKRIRANSKDIELERQRLALESTARFVDEHLSETKAIRGADATAAMLDTIRDAMRQVTVDGLWVEFGVATGRTLRLIAEHHLPAYGFDSFDGLPEDWRPGYGVGTFAQTPPEVGGAELLIGWFDRTLPRFLEAHPQPFAYVHLDADLYSSTATVFELAFDRFVPGTVITFDEYFNYPGWQHHEHKAFCEFLTSYEGSYQYLNYNATHEQVSVRLT